MKSSKTNLTEKKPKPNLGCPKENPKNPHDTVCKRMLIKHITSWVIQNTAYSRCLYTFATYTCRMYIRQSLQPQKYSAKYNGSVIHTRVNQKTQIAGTVFELPFAKKSNIKKNSKKIVQLPVLSAPFLFAYTAHPTPRDIRHATPQILNIEPIFIEKETSETKK